MGLRFRLTSVLRVRTLLEELEEKRLQLIRTRLQQANVSLQALRTSRDDSHKSFLDGRLELRASDLHFLESCTIQVRLAELAEIEKVNNLEAARMQQQLRFEKAHRDQLVIQKLRDRQAKKYLQEDSRKHQKELDEVYSLSQLGARQRLPSK